jgi:hypothetical protein
VTGEVQYIVGGKQYREKPSGGRAVVYSIVGALVIADFEIRSK